jgi:23S rRNA (guanosine2251-2'-O)-methyltransferase
MGIRKSFRKKPRFGGAPARPSAAPSHAGGAYWVYGYHPVTMALRNPTRRIRRLAATAASLPELTGDRRAEPVIERLDPAALAALLPAGAVHQGLAALVDPLPMVDLPDLIEDSADDPSARLIVLDQVTDPQNVGAILRSAAAFGATGLILTERHAAPESGVLAKAASGALDHLPLVRVVNLARAIEAIKHAGFWALGLAGEAEATIAEANPAGRVALVLGAEGSGLRRLTREHCDQLVRLPTAGPIDQLNVSNAAAVALYELVRATPKR